LGSQVGQVTGLSVSCSAGDTTTIHPLQATFNTALTSANYYIFWLQANPNMHNLYFLYVYAQGATPGAGCTTTYGSESGTWSEAAMAFDYVLVTQAAVTADPHFSGFSGDKFDFMGEAGKVFSLFSSFDLEINARFVAAQYPEYHGKEATFMGEIGIKQGVESSGASNNYILFTQKDDPKMYPFKMDPQVGDGRDNSTNNGTVSFLLNNGGSVIWRPPGQIEVRYPSYIITVSREFEKYSTLQDSIEEIYMSVSMALLSDFKGQAHGLIGQTTVPLEQRAVGPYNQFQGEGKIEGEMKDYIIENGDIFGVIFPFSMYNKTSSTKNSGGGGGFLLETALVADVIKK